jgi:hypothetical protein
MALSRTLKSQVYLLGPPFIWTRSTLTCD